MSRNFCKDVIDGVVLVLDDGVGVRVGFGIVCVIRDVGFVAFGSHETDKMSSLVGVVN